MFKNMFSKLKKRKEPKPTSDREVSQAPMAEEAPEPEKKARIVTAKKNRVVLEDTPKNGRNSTAKKSSTKKKKAVKNAGKNKR